MTSKVYAVQLRNIKATHAVVHQLAHLQVINRSRATASLSFAEAAAALKQFSVSLSPSGALALRPRDTIEVKLSFR